MSFVSLAAVRSHHPVSDTFRIGVHKHDIVFAPARSQIATLSWKQGDKIDIQLGRGDDAGRVRLVPDPKGWTLIKAGGGSSGILLKVGRHLFRDAPDRLTAAAVVTEVRDGAIIARLPWVAAAERNATERPAGSIPAAPGSEGLQHHPRAAGSLAPRPAIAESERAGPPTPRPPVPSAASVPQMGPRAVSNEPGAFGRMSAAQTELFVRAVARGASVKELETFVSAYPARYSRGTINYLKEKLATRIAAAVKAGAPAQVQAEAPTAAPVPAAPIPDKRASEQDEIARFIAEKGAKLVMGPEQVAAFLRDAGHKAIIREVNEGGPRAAVKIGYRPELDGAPVSLATLYDKANELREASGLRPVSPPIAA